MSVLVKGMEKPEHCGYCRFRYDGICHALQKTQYSMDECPLAGIDDVTDICVGDTISRQAAIKAICEDGTWLESQGCTDISMAERKQRDADILGELPSAQSEQQWIPCDEVSLKGYPKEDGFYYVTEQNYGFYLDADTRQTVAHTSHFKNGDFFDRYYDENHSNIVAWMPLPKPYEERDEE